MSFAAIIGFIFVANAYCFTYDRGNHVVRNFFGVLNAAETGDGRFRVLWHGTIGQGSQRIRDDNGRKLSGRPGGGRGVLRRRRHRANRRCGSRPVRPPDQLRRDRPRHRRHDLPRKAGDTVTFYEIDPDVIRVARNPKLFSYISECAPETEIVQGDARLTLSDSSAKPYDLIFIDAFLGAAIPTHLLTREAMAMYFGKLSPHGIVAVHVSNRNLELASVVAGVADANGAIARYYRGGDVQENAHDSKWVPKVVAVARNEEDFGVLAQSRYWPVHRAGSGAGGVVRRLFQRAGRTGAQMERADATDRDLDTALDKAQTKTPASLPGFCILGYRLSGWT